MPLAQVENVGNNLSMWTANNGLAVVLLFVVLISGGLAIWKIMNWTGTNVALPMRDAIITHLTNTDKTMNTMSDTLGGIAEELKTARTSHEQIHRKLDDLTRTAAKT